ncbi:MAG TPA: VWA domain-containing protein [Kiritimatiellia bacterium]|nr:VWA domain-containing protein [Kiritimatiellia bacterium]
MKWGAPEYLIWLWAMIPAAWFVFFMLRRREQRRAALISAQMLPHLSPGFSAKVRRQKAACWLLALLLILLALARPQWGFRWEEHRQRSLDIIVLMDTSKSMLAQDIKPSRLQQAKWAVSDLVKELKGDRIGLITFAGGSFLQCPLTIDYPALLMTLDDVYAGIIPRGGTAIAQALKEAAADFEKTGQAEKAVILISDGEDHEGDVESAIKQLKEEKIRVFAIGVGSLEGELIPSPDPAAEGPFLKDRASQVVKSSLRESVLEQIALETGGAYVRAAPGDFGLDRIYQNHIAPLQREDRDSRMLKAHEDRFAWLLAAAFLLLFIEAAIPERMKES